MSHDDWPPAGHVLRWIVVALVVLAVVWIALSTFFFTAGPVSESFPFYRPFFFPFGFLFGIFAIFIIFGILRWAFWGWGWGYRGRYWRHRDESYYILRRRYAKGEITKEQFDQMMRDLQEAESKTQK
jgi:uncharacterized membrane protein